MSIKLSFASWSRVAAGLAALALVGCGGGGGGTTPQSSTGAVTPESGGTVTLADNSARLEIPAGAVSSTTMITVSTSDVAAPSGVTVDGQILKFEPDGLVFQKPVTVTFQFKNATHPTVYWSNSSGGFDAIGGTVMGMSIAAQVTHFSSGFVADEKGASADCAPGMACGTGATCSYGGGTTNTGPLNGGKDASAPIDPGPTGSGSDTGGAGNTGTGGGTAPMSEPPATADPGSPRTGALSSDGTGAPSGSGGSTSGVAMCCTCEGGKYTCAACGGVAKDPGTCAEGASCSSTGMTCSSSAGTGTGGPLNGGADAGVPNGSGTGTEKPPGTAPVDPGSPAAGDAPAKMSALSSDGTCCTCGADGKFHCGGSCPGSNPIGGGVDASMTANPDGGGTGGPIDPGGGKCMQGGACQPGSAPCGDASVGGACTSCKCGADGHYQCSPCSNGGSDAGRPIDPTGDMCMPGGTCTPGGPSCGSASVGGACMKCDCGADGHYACGPCSTGAAGAGGGPIDPGGGQCVQGGTCTPGGPSCGNASVGGACMKCDCGADGHYKCAPCAGTGGGMDAGTVQPPVECLPGAPCAAAGMGCGGGGAGGCMKCMCGADLKLACTPCA